MSAIWDLPDFDAHESVHLFDDPKSGLRAVIALHSTHLGPGAGGTRFWHYADKQAAVTDALRLSRGMSYKNAMAGLPLGGGKGVVLADESRVKTPEMLAAFGRAIESLGGRYVTAEDVGMTTADMVAIAQRNRDMCPACLWIAAWPGAIRGRSLRAACIWGSRLRPNTGWVSIRWLASMLRCKAWVALVAALRGFWRAKGQS